MGDKTKFQPVTVHRDSVIMTIRIPVGMRDRIVEDIETQGDYNSMNQWIQQAIREFMAKRAELRARMGGGGERAIPSVRSLSHDDNRCVGKGVRKGRR